MSPCSIESLESRQFLSVTSYNFTTVASRVTTGIFYLTPEILSPQIRSGIISVGGTSGDDNVLVTRDGPIVTLPDTTRSYAIYSATGKLLESHRVSASQAHGRRIAFGDVLIHIHSGENDLYVQAKNINGVRLNMGAGNDKVAIDENVNLPTTLLGGAGNDTLIGGTRSDSIFGGAGDDYLLSGATVGPKDIMNGGPGNDFISTFTGSKVVYTFHADTGKIIRFFDIGSHSFLG